MCFVNRGVFCQRPRDMVSVPPELVDPAAPVSVELAACNPFSAFPTDPKGENSRKIRAVRAAELGLCDVVLRCDQRGSHSPSSSVHAGLRPLSTLFFLRFFLRVLNDIRWLRHCSPCGGGRAQPAPRSATVQLSPPFRSPPPPVPRPCWETVFSRSIRRSTNSTMRFQLGLKGCYERLSPHRPSPSWGWPNAGSRHGRRWWSPSAVPARH